MRHDWFVQVMIGNELQFGLPDLFIAHPRYGQKWVEVKNPLKFSFTERQVQKFPKLHAAGVGIWVLFSATDDELGKLFKPANGMEILLNWCNGVYNKGR
jgi:hypothetical protein